MAPKLSSALKIFLGVSVGGASIVVLFMLLMVFAPDRWAYKKQFEVSEFIIQEAETFRNVHGRIPNEKEIAEVMKKHRWQPSEACPCYQTTGELSYMVWFGYQTVGTSMVYRSENKTWNDEG